MKDRFLIHIKYLDIKKKEIVVNYIDDSEIELFYQIRDRQNESGNLLSVLSLGQNITSFFEGCTETYYYINREIVNNTATYNIDKEKPTSEEVIELIGSVVKLPEYAPMDVFDEEDLYYYNITKEYNFFFNYYQYKRIKYFIGDVCNDKILNDKDEEYFCRRIIGRKFVPHKIANRDNIIDGVLNK